MNLNAVSGHQGISHVLSDGEGPAGQDPLVIVIAASHFSTRAHAQRLVKICNR